MSEEKQLIAGRYQIQELIGSGGMGDVFKALDTKTGELIAAKLLHDSIIRENPDIVDRFQREGDALRELNHPNIVTILDTVEDDGNHYLIMEYVSGGSLRDLLDEHARLPIEAVLNVALDLADALTRAHRLNIIHRDIKPDNVLLAEDGTPRLTDFGVAHLGGRTRLTQTGSVIGTYSYLSPEACNGQELDERTDIWSFGVMLFEMLTGRVPFHETSTAAVLTAILTKPAPDITRLRPNTPPALLDLIYRMLEKDRDRRIPSIRLVGAELEALIRGVETPLRDKVLETGYALPAIGSRFVTPTGEREGVPAMIRSGRGTHGLSLYPDQQRVSGDYPIGSYVQDPSRTTQQTLAASKWPWLALTLSVTIIACAIVIVVAIIADPDQLGTAGRDEATHAPAGGGDSVFELLEVAPVAAGDYMILVGDFEALDDEPRDVSRFVVDDLAQALDTNVPFSNLRVRAYPAVITTSDEALAAAESNRAAVVVWGSYDAETIDVSVQVGDLSVFPYMAFERDLLERTLNIRVQIADERRESVSALVLTMLNALFNADGDAYEALRTGAIIDMLPDEAALAVSGSNVAAFVHRSGQADTSAESLGYIQQALDIDTANPLLLLQSTAIKERMGDFEGALTDARTANRIGPESWVMPNLMIASMTQDQGVLTFFDDAVNKRPDDWFIRFFRGSIYYSLGQMVPNARDLAKADLQAAIELGPEASFPYIYSALIALQEGRMADAAEVIDLVIREYPDPAVMDRMIRATFSENDETLSPYVVTLSAFTNQTLGRYGDVVDWAARGLKTYPEMVEFLMLKGMGFCGLDEFAHAEEAFSTALDIDPEFLLLYLLRADARLQQGDEAGAEADFNAIEASAQSAIYAPYVDAVRAGDLTCTTFLSPENPLFALATGAETAAAPAAPAAPVEPVEPDPLSAVEPVEPGEYMVLVADLEPVAGAEIRDVARFIADDLRITLEESVSANPIRVRRYPAMITSDAEAEAVANATGATVIIWGNYAADDIAVKVEVGSIDAFKYTPFDHAYLAATGNVRLRLTNERRESLAIPVVGILSMLDLADGNQFEFLMMLSLSDELDVVSGEIVGNSVGAHGHRAFMDYVTDTPAAIDEFAAALTLDAGNPLIYAYRGLLHLRLGDYAAAGTDLQTAARLGPEDWTSPLYFSMEGSPDDPTGDMAQVKALRPDDWYPFFLSGITSYTGFGDMAAALPDLERSIALEPDANLPFIPAMMIALHQGRVADAQAYAHTILTEFPNPDLTNRAFSILYGRQSETDLEAMITGEYFALGTNTVLGQYGSVVQTVESLREALVSQNMPPDTRDMFQRSPAFVDAYFWEGLAYCNLGEYALAEEAYTRVIRFGDVFADGKHALTRLLRGQMRLKLEDDTRAEADFVTARAHIWGDSFDPWVEAAIAGEWTCENFFEYTLP